MHRFFTESGMYVVISSIEYYNILKSDSMNIHAIILCCLGQDMEENLQIDGEVVFQLTIKFLKIYFTYCSSICMHEIGRLNRLTTHYIEIYF